MKGNKVIGVVFTLLICCAVCAVASEANTGSINSDEKSKESNRGLQAAKFMPLNKPNIRIKIPQFKDGKLECVIRAEEMTRVADDEIDIKGMDIEFFEGGKKEMQITFMSATYSLLEKKIKSKERAEVRRADYFTLVGDSLEFDVEKRQGRMIGKVRMIIHDSGSLLEPASEDAEFLKLQKGKNFSVLRVARLMCKAIEYGKQKREK